MFEKRDYHNTAIIFCIMILQGWVQNDPQSHQAIKSEN